jgi:hypothetical protein
MFVWQCASDVGFFGKRPPTGWNAAHAFNWCNYARKHHALHCMDDEPNFAPSIGDIVIFGDCTSVANAPHIGIVADYTGGDCITTIEANVCYDPETGEKFRRKHEDDPCPPGYSEGVGWDYRCWSKGEWTNEFGHGNYCFIQTGKLPLLGA